MSGLDPGARAGLEEALNALVPEASNHSKNFSAWRHAQQVEQQSVGGRIPNPARSRGFENWAS
jgi:hypothetical protein